MLYLLKISSKGREDMICFKCKSDIPGNSQYCIYCGFEQRKECPECGASIPSDARFCSQCNAKMKEKSEQETRRIPMTKSQIGFVCSSIVGTIAILFHIAGVIRIPGIVMVMIIVGIWGLVEIMKL